MGILQNLTAHIFGTKKQPYVLTVLEAVEILNGYNDSVPLNPDREYRTAAQFLYQKRALPDFFTQLPDQIQEKIIFGGMEDLTKGMIERPDPFWEFFWETGGALNVNHRLPDMIPPKATPAPPPPLFRRR